jgi:hypothetical protein
MRKKNNHCNWKKVSPSMWDLECKNRKIPVDEDALEVVRAATQEIEDSNLKKVVLYAVDSVARQ